MAAIGDIYVDVVTDPANQEAISGSLALAVASVSASGSIQLTAIGKAVIVSGVESSIV